MIHSFFSSSSDHRLVTIISLLLLNPLPFISGAPIKKIDHNFEVSRHKRQINLNNENIFLPKEEIIFEGLLGLIDFFISKNTNFSRI
jgi:hypothetical protein